MLNVEKARLAHLGIPRLTRSSRTNLESDFSRSGKPHFSTWPYLDACATENGWTEKQKAAALEFSSTTVLAVHALKTKKFSQADAGKMDEFIQANGLTAAAFNKLDDVQTKAVAEAITSTGWAHDKTDGAIQSALKALVYIATINDQGKAFTAAP